ncbi:TonB C-terminal domain-containing protein [Chryseobacterium sp. c4a]|uniref:TonB C-terminal domain-containing protein n=1 Tax=Chryseobacterium sp. c4a TaxID=1573582 RepID=UPI00135934EE|nr:TonB C-terminal domain-containing protein [Chryseobacterium sp. c4a]
MKKLLFLLFSLAFTVCFSQENKTEIPPTHDHSRDQFVPEDRKLAEYPGGISVFMQEVAGKIRTNKIKSPKGKIKAKAKFAVNVSGEIEKISVTGDNEDFNKEIERAITSTRKKWKPEEYKGTPVLSWYNLPFTMNID